jgi:hypothetical protein
MNPEFRRNLWQELSPQRLLATPLVLIAGAAFAYLTARNGAAGATLVAYLALLVLGVTGFLVGTRQAADAVVEEVQQRTWDLQRLSALGPWAMAWGKLFGRPLYTWYICLLCFLFSLVDPELGAAFLTRRGLFLLGALILIHALSLCLGLLTVQRGATHQDNRRPPPVTLTTALLILTLWIGAKALGLDALLYEEHQRAMEPLWFWGSPFDRPDFLLLSTWLFAAWAVLGAYRLMAQALALRTLPWALVGFLGFLAPYLAGLLVNRPDLEIPPLPPVAVSAWICLFLGAGAATGAAYLLAYFEEHDPLLFRRVALAARAGQWQRFLQELPLWLVCLAVGAACAVWTLPLAPPTPPWLLASLGGLLVAPLPLVLLAVRDISLLVFFRTLVRPGRAEVATLICLFLLYLVLPGIAGAAQLPALQFLLRPALAHAEAFQASLVLALHAVLAVGLAAHAWRQQVTAVLAPRPSGPPSASR